jgi:thioester reductase-like protein
MHVAVTGATGSLGSHLVASLAARDDVAEVVCLNRHGKVDAHARQLQAFTEKGIQLSGIAVAKLNVIETDMSQPNLGLTTAQYEHLTDRVTHIVHNAWLMNAKWPVKKFEPQLSIMRNLLDLASSIAGRRTRQVKVVFQFISSIATVGHWTLWTNLPSVPEDRMTIQSVLPTGYGDAKYICERMLDETLHKHPDRFRTMVVRPGQVAGSSVSGYWNPLEHLSFVVKSSQTLGVLPDLQGVLSWTPVDVAADTLTDLLALPDSTAHHPCYHIDNPTRQPWKEMIAVLADDLRIPPQNIVPFQEWVSRVKAYRRPQGAPEGDNPAFVLLGFLEDNFVRMSCGGLLLATAHTREHSSTLARYGPVEDSVARRYIQSWRKAGFLKP